MAHTCVASGLCPWVAVVEQRGLGHGGADVTVHSGLTCVRWIPTMPKLGFEDQGPSLLVACDVVTAPCGRCRHFVLFFIHTEYTSDLLAFAGAGIAGIQAILLQTLLKSFAKHSACRSSGLLSLSTVVCLWKYSWVLKQQLLPIPLCGRSPALRCATCAAAAACMVLSGIED